MPPVTSEYFFFSSDGLIWFSTAHGLTSFDGSDLVYYSNVQETNSFELNRIFAIVEDKDNNFYIGTPVGLYYYDRLNKIYSNYPYNYKDNQQPFNLGVDALYYDKKGILYAGSVNGGLFVIDPSKKQIQHINLNDTKPDNWQDRRFNTVCSFAKNISDDNKLWIGTFHGIYSYDKKEKKLNQNFEVINYKIHKYSKEIYDKQLIDVQKMDVANDSTIWFNSWTGGFAKYNTHTGKATIVFGRDALYNAKDLYYGYIIPKFTKVSGGKYLMGIYNGKTAIYEIHSGTVDYFNISQNNSSDEETRYVDTDYDGNIWVLQRGSLFMSAPSKKVLKTVRVPKLATSGVSRPQIRGIYFDTVSRLYYAAFMFSTGIHVYDTAMQLQNVIPTSFINNYYNRQSGIDKMITKDGDGRYWTTGWKVHVLLPREKKFTQVENKLATLKWLGPEDQFNDLAATQNGDILIKRTNGTIYHIDHKTLVADTIRCPTINQTAVEIKNATTWYDCIRDLVYLTGKEGMAQFDLGNKKMRIIPHVSLFGKLTSFQDVCVPTLDNNGKLWFMLPKYGIRIIDPETLQCIDSIKYGTKGLIDGGYTSIVGGSDHYILFRSDNGIIIYDYKKKQSFLFNQNNGLSSPDNISLLYSNGNVFIGQRSNRFEYFKLDNLDDYTSIVSSYLNSITYNSSNVLRQATARNDDPIKLTYEQNTLAFSFSAKEFFFPERIEYAYQLLPLEKDWQYTNYFNRKIIYTKLQPGKYSFRLKAQIQGGNWEMEPIVYTIIIKPAFWQTNLFKILLSLLVSIVAAYLILNRIKGIRRKEQQKTMYEKELLELEAKALRSQMNPHFVFNSLNSIKALINKNENDIAVRYLTTFSKLIRTLFQNSDKREVSLYEELETCKLYSQLEQMRFGNKIEFLFEVSDGIDLKDIKVPALILQPFIENAIWHGLVPREIGGKVIVSVREKGNIVECIIDDNGIGRDKSKHFKPHYEATYQSKGIGLTQSRLELDKKLNEREDTVQLIDKKDGTGQAIGTTAIITFKNSEKEESASKL